MKWLIVGVDLGVTVGLAALSLDGSPVSVQSRRSWSFSELIKTITELGEPTVISSDVSPAFDLLERLSHKLNAVLFVPLISMGSDEKRQTSKTFALLHGSKLRNTHEVDALAAALKAHQHYVKKFAHVVSYLEEQGVKVSVDDVKDLVVKGHIVKRAVQILQAPEKVEVPMIRRMVPSEERMKRLVDELEDRLTRERLRSKRLRTTNRELGAEIRALKVEIDRLNERVTDVRSEQSAQARREREYQLLLDETLRVKAKVAEYQGQLASC